MCTGEVSVEVLPSSNSQSQLQLPALVLLVKVTVAAGKTCDAGVAVKAGTGVGYTTSGRVVSLIQPKNDSVLRVTL